MCHPVFLWLIIFVYGTLLLIYRYFDINNWYHKTNWYPRWVLQTPQPRVEYWSRGMASKLRPGLRTLAGLESRYCLFKNYNSSDRRSHLGTLSLECLFSSSFDNTRLSWTIFNPTLSAEYSAVYLLPFTAQTVSDMLPPFGRIKPVQTSIGKPHKNLFLVIPPQKL